MKKGDKNDIKEETVLFSLEITILEMNKVIQKEFCIIGLFKRHRRRTNL